MRVTIGAFALILAGLTVLGVWSAQEIADGSDLARARDAATVQRKAQDLLLQLLNEETGVRGFLITGRAESLRPYRSGRRAALADLRALEAATTRHLELRRLPSETQPLVQALDRFFAAQVALGEQGSSGLQRARGKTEDGTRLFDAFRRSAGHMVESARTLQLQAQQAQSKRARRLTALLAVLGSVAFVLTVVLGVLLPKRAARVVALLARERGLAQEETARAEALAKVGALLSGIATSERLTDAVTHEICQLVGARGASIYLADERRSILRLASGSGATAELRDVWSELPISVEAPVGDAVREGRMILLGSPGAIDEAYPALATLRAEVDDAAWATLPLGPIERPLGALSFNFADAQTFASGERSLLLGVTERVSDALTRASLFDQQQQIAETLQASLLPRRLTAPSGVEIASLYVAAGPAHEVGGDFYDGFATASGTAYVIGDVCGKGPEAAALTSLCRHTLRAFAHDDRPRTPLELLAKLNQAIRAHGDRFATVQYAHLEIADRVCRIELASGGHPPALIVRAGGRVEELSGATGPLLGPLAVWKGQEQQAELAVGDVLVLYTDGVTEARNGRDQFGEERLRAALAVPPNSAAEITTRIEAALASFTTKAFSDDIAVLALRFQGAPAAADAPP